MITPQIETATPTATVNFDTFPPAGNYGPITTTFTPASSCTRVAFQTGVPFLSLSPTTVVGGHPDCYPGSRLYQLHYGIMTINSRYYSPALYCPYGYTTATSWDPAFASAFNEEPKPYFEAAYYCCPSYVLSATFRYKVCAGMR